MKDKITSEQIVEVYLKKGCNVSATCTALGIARKTFYEWKNERPELSEKISDADEALIDFTESKLMNNIEQGDNTCIIFFLKTKGRKRGYIERMESQVTTIDDAGKETGINVAQLPTALIQQILAATK